MGSFSGKGISLKNRSLLVIIGITLLITLFCSCSPKYEQDKLATSFLTSFYSASWENYPYLPPMATQEEAAVYIVELESYLKELFANYLTEECFNKLMANRVLGSVQKYAMENRCNFNLERINKEFNKNSKYAEYTLNLLQYNTAAELLQSWEVVTEISFIKIEKNWKINSVQIYGLVFTME